MTQPDTPLVLIEVENGVARCHHVSGAAQVFILDWDTVDASPDKQEDLPEAFERAFPDVAKALKEAKGDA
jgi:hypothetical protein